MCVCARVCVCVHVCIYVCLNKHFLIVGKQKSNVHTGRHVMVSQVVGLGFIRIRECNGIKHRCSAGCQRGLGGDHRTQRDLGKADIL